MNVVAYVPDLMDRSRLGQVNAEVSFVGSPAAAVEKSATADVVVLDLGRPGVMEVLGSLGAVRVICFASHVDVEVIQAAKAAGINEVMPRSRFFSHVNELLSEQQ